MIRLAIAEDHQSLIDGLVMLLKHEEQIRIVGTANDGESLLNIVRLKQPNVVLTDIRMPKIDGIIATSLIKKEFPEIKVIAFTMFDQDEAVSQMRCAGASGYILKNATLLEVVTAIKTVAEGKTYFDKRITNNALASTTKKKDTLTARQTEILKLIGQGKTSKIIAEELFIGVHTVDTHRKNIARALGLKGKGELMRYALTKKYNFKG